MNTSKNENTWKRRDFISTLAVTSGVLLPGFALARNFVLNEPMTVQQVIDIILKNIPSAPFKNTVDTIKAGSPTQKITSIVTTMFATDEVIEKTAALGANFIIAHEPSFYNHLDETDWLQKDEVYQRKLNLLNKNKIALWRFHDYWHAYRPDGILMGVLKTLEWDNYYDAAHPEFITIPTDSFKNIIAHVKNKMGIKTVRIMGDSSQSCTRIALSPGAWGGRTQIGSLMKVKPDLFICGELNEWETNEYIRDAQHMGEKISLMVLGHTVSEEPGMQYLAEWLQPKLPGMKITHIPSNDPFTWV